MKRKTIKRDVSLEGVSLHSGSEAKITFKRASEGSGIFFVRSDLKGAPKVRAIPGNVSDLLRGTTLSEGGAKVGVVEHVLAAVSSLGISDIEIDVFGEEPPAMDGSALPFLHALKEAGIAPLKKEYAPLILKKEMIIEENGSIIYAYPSDRFAVSFVIDFPGTVIGRQEISLVLTEEAFESEVAPARTFGFVSEIEELKKQGLALGATLENALAVGEKGYMNPPRFKDEPVRHKVLDLIGDLALLNRPIKANIVAERSSHRLNSKLVSALARA